jgi:hypothetical protein
MNKNIAKKAGRPRMDRDKAKGERLILRLSAADRARYDAKAIKNGMKLSAWIRISLDRAS